MIDVPRLEKRNDNIIYELPNGVPLLGILQLLGGLPLWSFAGWKGSTLTTDLGVNSTVPETLVMVLELAPWNTPCVVGSGPLPALSTELWELGAVRAPPQGTGKLDKPTFTDCGSTHGQSGLLQAWPKWLAVREDPCFKSIMDFGGVLPSSTTNGKLVPYDLEPLQCDSPEGIPPHTE